MSHSTNLEANKLKSFSTLLLLQDEPTSPLMGPQAILSSVNNTESNKGLVGQGGSVVRSEEEAREDKRASDIPTLDAEQRTRKAVALSDEWDKRRHDPNRAWHCGSIKDGPQRLVNP
ncbi:hypothetical protein STEG23_003919, partial [Scotinomys teguina]